MADIILTKKIKSIKIYPAVEATANFQTTSYDVVWGSELPLPSTFTIIGWDGLASTPKQGDGYSGSRPVVDSGGLKGDITFEMAALQKKTSFDVDSLRIDNIIKASTKDLLYNYPYFRVDVTRQDNSTYTVICGMAIRKISKTSKLWSVTLRPNKVLDDDLTVEDVKLNIVKIDVDDLSPTKVRVTFYTNKSGRGFVYYDPLGGSVLNKRLNGSRSLYKHSFDLIVPSNTSVVNFKCRFQTDDGTEDITTETKKFTKGEVSTPLVVSTPTFTPGAAAGRGFVRWSTDRPATSYAIADESNPPTEVFAKTDLVQEHEVEVFFSTLATQLNFQAVSTDDEGYTGRSRVVTVDVAATNPPKVSNLFVEETTSGSIKVSFNTDKLCTAILEYGISTGFGNKTTNSGITAYSHEIEITGLDDDTKYFIRAEAETPSPGSQKGLSNQVVIKTLRSPAPSETAFNVINTADPNIKQINFTTNVLARYSIEHSEDRYFNKSVKEPRSSTLSITHQYLLDISRYPDGADIYVRAVMDDGDGNVGTSESSLVVKSANNDVVVNDILLERITPTQADFFVSLSGSAKVFLSYSSFEDMSNAEIFPTTITSTSQHELQGSYVGRGSGVDIWYTVSVFNAAGNQVIFTSAPRKFTTPNEQSPVITDVSIEKKFGQSDIILVRAKSNVPIFSEVRWGLSKNNLYRSVRGVYDYVTEHVIEVTITEEIASSSYIYLQIGGSGQKGISIFSDIERYLFIRGTAALLITDIIDHNGLTPNQRSIEWKTSEPTSGTLFFGREDDLNDRITIEDYRLDHRVLLDVSNFATDEDYYFKIESRTSDGRVDTSSEVSGTKLDPTGDISSIYDYDIDTSYFVIECHTTKPGKIKIGFTYPGIGGGESGFSSETTNNHRFVFTPGAPPGTVITWEVRFHPADGSPTITSASQTTTLASSGNDKVRFQLFKLSQDVDHVNVIQADATVAPGGDVGWKIGLGRSGYTAKFNRPSVGTGTTQYQIDFIASDDILKQGYAWLKCISERSGYDSEETLVKNQFVGKSNTPSEMRANEISNVAINYNSIADSLTVTWSTTSASTKDHHVMYSLDGNRLELDNKVVELSATNSPSLVVDVSSVPSGGWVFLRPITGKPVAFSGQPYKYEWHIGDVVTWQKP